jgi:CrcB protein
MIANATVHAAYLGFRDRVESPPARNPGCYSGADRAGEWMTKLLFIALGGGLGAVLRYAVSSGAQRLTDGTFPVGTLVVNVLGCIGIGLFGTLLTGPIMVREEMRFAVLIGFLGGFTTFSTFGFETYALLADGEWWRAAANITLQNTLGLAAVFCGYRMAVLWQGA